MEEGERRLRVPMRQEEEMGEEPKEPKELLQGEPAQEEPEEGQEGQQLVEQEGQREAEQVP